MEDINIYVCNACSEDRHCTFITQESGNIFVNMCPMGERAKWKELIKSE